MSTRRRLSQLLMASHIGLILLFAVVLLATGFGTIRSAVSGQARIEAERAATEAQRRVRDWRRELGVGADLLAHQPTLKFYLARGQVTKARALVNDFHATSAIEYVRVQWRGRTLAEAGRTPPAFASGLSFDRHGRAWWVVERVIPGLPQASIVAAEPLGNRLLASERLTLVTIILRPLAPTPANPVPPANAWTRTLRQVSRTGEPITLGAIDDDAAARVVRLQDDHGTPVALVAARVGNDWVERRFFEWFAAFGVSILATGALALGLAILLASRIARPFAQLAVDAERLGSGDLDTPIKLPVTFLAEPAALAASLEEMRKQVGTLTATERSQREELDAVLDGVDEGIVGVDAADCIHYANRQFLALVGRTREDVLGLPVDVVLLPIGDLDAGGDDAPVGLPGLERYTPTGKMRPLTVRRLAASGNRKVLVVREENAIEAARAMRDHILANLSHEFQTPLSAQIASIELLRDHLRTSHDAVASRLADAQYRGTMRLSQLVENLLDSVRIESGEMRLRRQPLDLATVVGEAIDLMKPLLDQRDQHVVRTLVAGPTLIGDAPRLFSVMVNLLANANKFAPDGTTLWVDMAWADDSVTVWVEDEGPGLPPGHSIRDLFAPFRRSPHEEPSQRGTGLGLAIVHAVVAAHGGQVNIAPPEQGRGARIGVVLPVVPVAGEPRAADPTPATQDAAADPHASTAP